MNMWRKKRGRKPKIPDDNDKSIKISKSKITPKPIDVDKPKKNLADHIKSNLNNY